jgi:hypothetical protein
MKAATIKKKHGPEFKIQKDIIKFLEARGWFVQRMVGNLYQSGIADLYVAHLRYGPRWLEVKYAKRYKFTNAQLQKFPMFEAVGVGIWVLTAATDLEYKKLFLPPNWREYLHDRKL